MNKLKASQLSRALSKVIYNKPFRKIVGAAQSSWLLSKSPDRVLENLNSQLSQLFPPYCGENNG